AVNVLCRSIAELCIADHQGDAREIADWLSNKTEATWLSWLTRSDATVHVAERATEIVGVGMIDSHGEVLLNYVRPDARFSGVSKELLASLENVATTEGNRKCVLESTKTAKKFYERCGYRAVNKTSLKMVKLL
ncbi:GNAT family N-acetyltransferase, partial [Sulfitobacter donghicola]